MRVQGNWKRLFQPIARSMFHEASCRGMQQFLVEWLALDGVNRDVLHRL